VDHSRGLQSVAGAPVSHVTLGDLVQFPLNQRNQLIERSPVAICQLAEKTCDFVSRRYHRRLRVSIAPIR